VPFPESPWHDRVLLLVTGSILLLAALSIGFALAAVLLRMRNNHVARRWDRCEREWEPVLFDVMAGAVPPDRLAREVRRRDEAYFLGLLSRLARQVRGPELARLAEAAAPFLARPAADLRRGAPEERALAVAALGLLGGPAHVRLVIDALDDPAPLVAMSAARALTRRRDPEHAAALLARLDRLRHWRPGFLAAMLAALGPDAAAALRRTLADAGAASAVRVVAAEALLRLNDPGAAGPAAGVAAADPDPEVVAAALRLLARVGDGSHLAPVRRLAASPVEIVRIGAVRALAALGEPADLPLLRQALDDPSIWVAEHAARGLARGPGRALLAAMAESGADRARLAGEALAEVTA
jgi:hypothetical protein